MLTIQIPSSPKTYAINFHADFASSHENIEKCIGKKNHLYITDENVFHKTAFFEGMDTKNIVVLPAGEQHKTWESITKILDACFASELDRSSVLVAVGGGVVGDMTGFAASIFMRGIECVQVPTTLLSMVDSSVGGKTGIDTEHGKNLIGAFHQPLEVVCCKEFLHTLEFVELQNGLSEMVKHGILGSADHFAHLENFAENFKTSFAQMQQDESMRNALFDLVPESIAVKQKMVQQDEKEAGVRGYLNLGHTYGHAIELLSNFTVPHGIGVAKGISCAMKESGTRGLIEDGSVIPRIENVFSHLHIDLSHSFSAEEIEKAMVHDKKKKNGVIRLILIRDIGVVEYGDL